MDKIGTIISYIIYNEIGRYIKNEEFKKYTTLKLGGKFHMIIFPTTIEKLKLIVDFLYKIDMEFMVLGNGSNILCSDDEYDGVVLSFKDIDPLCLQINDELIVNSGVKLNFLYHKIGEYYGFDKLSLIPGTIGGGVISNCGAYGFNISEIIKEVCIYENGKELWIENDGNIFGYRTSVFKNSQKVILYVKLKLIKHKCDLIKWKKEKLKSQNIEGYNAGSTFKNPPGYSAWKLIKEHSTTKNVNDCFVSEVHANMFYHNGKGKSCDMYNLMENVKKEVFKKTGIMLENEWILFNFKQKN